jgi:uncharacterized protein YlxW (UPF0749 family)
VEGERGGNCPQVLHSICHTFCTVTGAILMVYVAALSILLTLMALGFSIAAFARASSAQVSASRSPAKQVSTLLTEMADLQSSLDSLTTSHKRLSARVGMRQLRDERRAAGSSDEHEPIPFGDKAALRAKYLNGKSPKEIAKLHVEREQPSEEQ